MSLASLGYPKLVGTVINLIVAFSEQKIDHHDVEKTKFMKTTDLMRSRFSPVRRTQQNCKLSEDGR